MTKRSQKQRLPQTKKRQQTRTPSPLVKQILYGVLFLFFCAALIFGVYKISRVERWQIEAVAATGGETVPHEQVEAAVAGALEGTYYGLIPRRFVYALPNDEIVAAAKRVLRVKDASVEVEGRTLHITFTEYQPYALVCFESQCAFVDDMGVAFAPAPDLKGRSLIRVGVANEIEPGSVPVEPEMLAMLLALRDALHETYSWGMSGVTLQESDTNVLWFDESKVMVLRRDGVEDVLARLGQILANEQFSHLEPGNFEYIDMRYGNKVFVKEVGVDDGIEGGELQAVAGEGADQLEAEA